MKFRLLTAIACSAMAIVSCDEDTEGIGASLTKSTDMLEISTGIYKAYSKSVLADSVYARNYDNFFGKIKDPETGTYVKTELMTQVNMLEDYKLPNESNILKTGADGKAEADSCELWIYFINSESYGDSLAPMKMNVLELNEPMPDNKTYYTNYDPKAEGYIRTDGLKKSLAFTMANLTYSDSIRNLTGYFDIARISLNDPYTDKAGNSYDNYGSYILRNYYDHPAYFKNSYSFIHQVCPGFYFELSDGIGLMAKLAYIELRTFYTYQNDTTSRSASMVLSSTSEVLKTTRVTNDRASLERLVADQSCTYIKAPAGIFTEVTLPVDDIMQTHQNDSLLSVNISIKRQNSQLSNDPYLLDIPSNVLMVQKDSLNTFFETESLHNYTSSFLSTLSLNSYTFSNIGNLITLMYTAKEKGLSTDPNWTEKHPNWDKVLLVPVTVGTTTSSSGSSTITSISNEMGLSSTRLMGGADTPIEVEVIYAKFKTQ